MSALSDAILGAKGTAPAAAAPEESDLDVAAHAAADELLAALDKKDAKGIRRALKNLRTIDSED